MITEKEVDIIHVFLLSEQVLLETQNSANKGGFFNYRKKLYFLILKRIGKKTL